MKKLITRMTMLLAFAAITTSASAQFDALDFIQQDATMIVVESSQLKGEVNSLIQKMKNNHPSLANDLIDFNASYADLESRVAVLNERIVSLGYTNPNSEELAAKGIILIQHMMLMSDEKLSFSSGDQSAGARVRTGMQELKNLAQDIRAEVIGMKNN